VHKTTSHAKNTKMTKF